MFFVTEDGIVQSFVVGGASLLSGAKKLAEKRAKTKLTWNETDGGWEAVVNHITYINTYRIREGR